MCRFSLLWTGCRKPRVCTRKIGWPNGKERGRGVRVEPSRWGVSLRTMKTNFTALPVDACHSVWKHVTEMLLSNKIKISVTQPTFILKCGQLCNSRDLLTNFNKRLKCSLKLWNKFQNYWNITLKNIQWCMSCKLLEDIK